MAHLIPGQIANVGDTFSRGNTQYIAVQMIHSGNNLMSVCRGCAFYRNGKDTCSPDTVPDCVSEDVIFVEDHSPQG